MNDWLDAITAAGIDEVKAVVEAAYENFEQGYQSFRAELDENRLRGQRLIDVGARVPGLSEYIYGQWCVLKSVVEVIELRVQAATQKARVYYTESYPRSLADRQIEHYAKADAAVLALTESLIRINLVLNKWEGLSKGVERLHFQVRTIADLRKAGLDDTAY